MPTDDDLDFLSDGAGRSGTSHADAARQAVENVRTPLLDWAARALAVRMPAATVYRGAKGVAQCRLDLDRHLKALLGDTDGDDAAVVAAYRQWALASIWAPRGSTAEALDVGLEVLAESLVRFAPWPHGPRLARLVAQAVEAGDPQVQTAVAQRCTSG